MSHTKWNYNWKHIDDHDQLSDVSLQNFQTNDSSTMCKFCGKKSTCWFCTESLLLRRTDNVCSNHDFLISIDNAPCKICLANGTFVQTANFPFYVNNNKKVYIPSELLVKLPNEVENHLFYKNEEGITFVLTFDE